ncbi:glutathione S-transferase family protein [Neptuniibacter sp. CAU 1671]|uniref:glutathione S-transferase family protein n=1 Tax=Neptuniibacter sp. CAU 1671 TaxID=3032593 RepID=UPI0023DB86CB|nr:glutathione S-transferase family protein [Neptuniibacter sp. CAU 1671]MDF2180718.1 glutathione S-transferase family protein [Neptuniibacter sp. CAU 1671]
MAEVEIFGPNFSTFVRSVMLACEEKGIPYRQHMEADGVPVGMHSAPHMKLHPFGKVPVLLHRGQTLCETTAILRYLEALCPDRPLQPSDPWARAQLDQWCSFVSLYLDQALIRRYLLEFVFPKGEGGVVREDRVERALPEVHKMLKFIESQLDGKSYLLGDELTMVDLLLLPMLDYLLKWPQTQAVAQAYPNIVSYTELLRQRPSAQKILV